MDEIIKYIDIVKFNNIIENNGTNIGYLVIVLGIIILLNVIQGLYNFVSKILVVYIMLIVIMRLYVTYIINNDNSDDASLYYNPVYNELIITQLKFYKSITYVETNTRNLINNKLFFDIIYHINPLKIYKK